MPASLVSRIERFKEYIAETPSIPANAFDLMEEVIRELKSLSERSARCSQLEEINDSIINQAFLDSLIALGAGEVEKSLKERLRSIEDTIQDQNILLQDLREYLEGYRTQNSKDLIERITRHRPAPSPGEKTILLKKIFALNDMMIAGFMNSFPSLRYTPLDPSQNLLFEVYAVGGRPYTGPHQTEEFPRSRVRTIPDVSTSGISWSEVTAPPNFTYYLTEPPPGGDSNGA